MAQHSIILLIVSVQIIPLNPAYLPAISITSQWQARERRVGEGGRQGKTKHPGFWG